MSNLRKSYRTIVEYATETPFNIIVYAGFGALAGGLGGQLLDIIPFVGDYIPQAIKTVTALDLQNNLDKLGAVYGFAHCLVEGMFFHKRIERATSLDDKIM